VVNGELKDVPIVLVVEDEEWLQEIVHDALREGGFDVTIVASGQEAVAKLESGVVKYSALVTDVNLKGPMTGWEIARLVRQIDPALPIVYMTGAAADHSTKVERATPVFPIEKIICSKSASAGTGRPELSLKAGASCGVHAVWTIIGHSSHRESMRHEQPAVPASFVRIPPRRRYSVSQGARTVEGVGTKYGACACTGLERPSEN
jgi:CheY-like chemotaxis protein